MTAPLERWEGVDTRQLARRWGVPEVHAYAALGSTNDRARELASQGAPPGTVVLAEEQTAGRGRVGRGWASPPGVGLWFTVVAGPAALADPGAVPLLAGAAVAARLDAFAGGGRVMVKWPNDLWLGGRKLGGILCEAVWEGGVPALLVVGVGINVLQTPEQFPPELRERATSLQREAGAEPVDRAAVAAAVIGGLRAALAAPPEDDAWRRELARRDLLLHSPVEVTDPATGARLATGIAAGLAPGGALLVREQDGAMRTIHSGTVRSLATTAEKR